MQYTTKLSFVILAVMVAGIIAALVMETSAGPSFRPEDHASYEECVQNIPTEWGPGSIERSGAEDACYYVHERGR